MPLTPRSPGRPRDAGVDAAVLAATQDLLLERGFDRVSLEAVAARAGVGKAAIYRRWSGKTALVVAAAAELNELPAVPDTGELREDLLACGRAFVRDDRAHRVLVSLMTAIMHHPDLRIAAREALGAPFSALFDAVVSRAVARGQAPPSTDRSIVGDIFPAMAFHRTAALGLPIDEEFVVAVVDGVLLPLLSR